MVKLIIKLPENMDANLLMQSALALADYKHRQHSYFKLKDYDELNYYDDYDLLSFEPDFVLHSPTSYENYVAGVREYELSADILDPFLMEILSELQRIVPFEMFFDNRGKCDPATYDELYSVFDPTVQHC